MEKLYSKSKSTFLSFYQRHETLVTVIVFFAGFLFDILTLGRIDDLRNLIQQFIFLLCLGSLLLIELKIEFENFQMTSKLKKIWQYHSLIIHFLFGSLLSMYTIFYYSSASAIASFIFLALILGLAFANEFTKFQNMGIFFRNILFNICLLSFFCLIYPILFGFIGGLLFWFGIISSLFVIISFQKLLLKIHNDKKTFFKNKVFLPSIIIHILFILAYYTSLIPPVPVALKKIGIYYSIDKKDGNYIGKYLDQMPFFWNKGSQNYLARTGDKIFVLLSIFAPTAFNDKIYLNWNCTDNNGYNSRDSIPLQIIGGRDEGFRGYGSKEHFSPGSCLITVETSDKREVGRINLKILMDQSQDKREFITDYF